MEKKKPNRKKQANIFIRVTTEKKENVKKACNNAKMTVNQAGEMLFDQFITKYK